MTDSPWARVAVGCAVARQVNHRAEPPRLAPLRQQRIVAPRQRELPPCLAIASIVDLSRDAFRQCLSTSTRGSAPIRTQPFRRTQRIGSPRPPTTFRPPTTRAGNRRFGRLSALRAHTKAPSKIYFDRKTLMALNRPKAARTEQERAGGCEEEHTRAGAAHRHAVGSRHRQGQRPRLAICHRDARRTSVVAIRPVVHKGCRTVRREALVVWGILGLLRMQRHAVTICGCAANQAPASDPTGTRRGGELLVGASHCPV
jgi:hypothetical protein